MVVVEVECTIVTAVGQTPKKAECGTQSFHLHIFPGEKDYDGFGYHCRLQIFEDGLSPQKRKYLAHAGDQREIVSFVLQKTSNSWDDGLFGVSDAAKIRAQQVLWTRGSAWRNFSRRPGTRSIRDMVSLNKSILSTLRPVFWSRDVRLSMWIATSFSEMGG